MTNMSAEEGPLSFEACSDKQRRLTASSVIHDGTHEEYKGARRPRVALPVCIVNEAFREPVRSARF